MPETGALEPDELELEPELPEDEAELPEDVPLLHADAAFSFARRSASSLFNWLCCSWSFFVYAEA